MSVIKTDAAPAAIGPYSQARGGHGLVFISGQLPLDPETGELVSEDAVDQARQCLRNVESIAKAAGGSLGDILKTTVLVTNLSQFAGINAAYGDFFTEPFPARATYEVPALPKTAKVEIEAVLSLKN